MSRELPYIFMSWKGDEELEIARLLKQWLEQYFQVKIFLSADDCAEENDWQESIRRAVKDSDFGIVVLSHRNEHAPWIMYEMGLIDATHNYKGLAPIALDFNPREQHEIIGTRTIYPFREQEIISLFKRIQRDINPKTSVDNNLENYINKCFTENKKIVSDTINKIKKNTNIKNVNCRLDTKSSANSAINNESNKVPYIDSCQTTDYDIESKLEETCFFIKQKVDIKKLFGKLLNAKRIINNFYLCKETSEDKSSIVCLLVDIRNGLIDCIPYIELLLQCENNDNIKKAIPLLEKEEMILISMAKKLQSRENEYDRKLIDAFAEEDSIRKIFNLFLSQKLDVKKNLFEHNFS